ncbi:phage tail protein [Escherichia coli]|nr:phage tail protein [Escherichia coli]
MNRNDAPAKHSKPFGVNGRREPLTADTPAGDNTASYEQGFPPITMIPKTAGGLPPKGQDMNQILFELSALARWFSTGALNAYDAEFATAIDGYPKGSLLVGNDGSTMYMCESDGNTADPNTGGTGWFNLTAAIKAGSDCVRRSGDTMTGELKIGTVNALRIFDAAFGLIFRRSEEFLHLIPTAEGQGENGDIGPLRPFAINLRTGAISVSHGAKIDNGLALGTDNALGGNSVVLGDNDTGIKWVGDGVFDVYCNGAPVFRFQNGTLQSNRPLNVSGRVTPTDYGNFDERYLQGSGAVQDVRYGSEVYHDPGGNEISWIFRAPSGCVLSGINVQETGSHSADNIGGVYYRPLQKLVNGSWYNVASI